MTALFKRTFRLAPIAVLGLSLAGCVDLGTSLLVTAASLRSLRISVTDEAGHPIPGARVSLYKKVPDRIHGGFNEVAVLTAPLVTDEKGSVLARLVRCSSVIVQVTLPDGRAMRSEQPWPKAGAELHLVVEGPQVAPNHPQEATPGEHPPPVPRPSAGAPQL